VLIVCCISILSWFIAAQGHDTDPDCNDLPHLKMAGFDSPTPGWVSLPADMVLGPGHSLH